jgi:hypothetical protein
MKFINNNSAFSIFGEVFKGYPLTKDTVVGCTPGGASHGIKEATVDVPPGDYWVRISTVPDARLVCQIGGVRENSTVTFAQDNRIIVQ